MGGEAGQYVFGDSDGDIDTSKGMNCKMVDVGIAANPGSTLGATTSFAIKGNYLGSLMNENAGNLTPPATPPQADRLGPASTIQQLSLDSVGSALQCPPQRALGLSSIHSTTTKRAASVELPRSSPRNGRPPFPCSNRGRQRVKDGRGSTRHLAAREVPHRLFDGHCHATGDSHSIEPSHPIPRDCGYETITPPTVEAPKENVTRLAGPVPVLVDSRYPKLIMQPESSPISQEQLAAEVKGIYGGLVMVEAKCINIDAAQAADPNSTLGPEQWQALIALHRTLLYEHHDFLMATQHPSVTPALSGLAQKYSLPARMWRHGIHAFLEVLRQRKPESQDYMLAFIYLAYQMMALLFETVPAFTDTWIECLGDLARYRMAVAEEKELHTTWGGVAARWYNLANNRHPAIGRLYHHLGILERPSLRKMSLYAKSLSCIIPFPNARDSLATLCGPIIRDKERIENDIAEAAYPLTPPANLPEQSDPNEAFESRTAPTGDSGVNTHHFRRDRNSNIWEPSIHCTLQGQQTESFPDSGAPANFLSKSFVNRLGLVINTEASKPFKNGIGKLFTSLGTVNIPLYFKGETELHQVEFHVMATALRDVVLGGPFLRLTQTLSRFRTRITKTLRHNIWSRLCFVRGTHQYVWGLLNGEIVEALPDTGSDIPVISTEFARKNGLRIDTSAQHRIGVMFADGSIAMTRGLVQNASWEFKSSPGKSHGLDFYVLDDLDCDIILNYEFLDETNAFVSHEASFTETPDLCTDDLGSFFAITKAPDVKQNARNWLSNNSCASINDQGGSLQELQNTRLELLHIKTDHMSQIMTLPASERAQATTNFRGWWKPKWDKVNADLNAKEPQLRDNPRIEEQALSCFGNKARPANRVHRPAANAEGQPFRVAAGTRAP